MALSSDDVVNWQLKTGMRGYLIPQVDELLDEVADELDRLHGRIRELEAEREAVKHSLDDQLEVEETLRRTLYQAQKAADQTIEDARQTASQIVADGRLESDAILAAAREQAQATYDDAVREATDERAAVRSSLEAEEARMRALRSELRTEIAHLRTIEEETRRLLRGLYEDRLNELSEPLSALPDIESLGDLEAPDTPAAPTDGDPDDAGRTDAAPLAEADAQDDPVATDADVVADSSTDGAPTVMPPAPADGGDEAEEPVVVVQAPTSHPEPAAESESEVDGAPTAPHEQDAPAVAGTVEPSTQFEGEGRRPDGAPAYLDAVSEALAAIQANDAEDAVEDDLLDDVAELDQRPRAEDLFDGAPPRRRRRSG